ncbi:hypothetical protein NQ317_015759 [Molorchus minor]|uniref:Uncharacterized protein n=1 Tax=Molorchus minor TaxID=1323400 RepID=A0ABQ9K4Y7_9CUCU|nr:hypothetical protein NQ317_015759 [Molorchus minor]
MRKTTHYVTYYNKQKNRQTTKQTNLESTIPSFNEFTLLIKKRENLEQSRIFRDSIESAMEKEKQPKNADTETGDKETGADKNKNQGNMNTLSTKLSTDQLICKSPQESPSVSVKSVKTGKCQGMERQRVVLYLGGLQFLLGFMMVAFGILAIMHKASLSQLGGGIWGGCLAMSTGVAGILTAAGSLCPLKTTPQRVAYTVFLALSLISLAVSQLIVVIAATGLARDINSAETELEKEESDIPSHPGKIAIEIPGNYLGLLFNIALIIVSSLECICAALASYKSSRDLCPCFRKNEVYRDNINIHRSHAIVSSWLGKQAVPPPIYLVTGPPSSLGASKPASKQKVKLFQYFEKVIRANGSFGLDLEAVIGCVFDSGLRCTATDNAIPNVWISPDTSPIGTSAFADYIPPSIPRRDMQAHGIRKKYRAKSKSKSREREPTPKRSRSTSKSQERQVTEEDLARTYTGLDRTMAEEFIDMCESRNNSLCSDFSCSSCQSPCTTGCSSSGCNSNSDAASHEYLVNKV